MLRAGQFVHNEDNFKSQAKTDGEGALGHATDTRHLGAPSTLPSAGPRPSPPRGEVGARGRHRGVRGRRQGLSD